MSREDVLLGMLGAVFVVAGIAWLMYFMIRLARSGRLEGTETPLQMLVERLIVAAGVILIAIVVFGIGSLLGLFG